MKRCRRQLASDKNVQLNDIFANFQRSNEELEFRKDGAELEEIAFNLAMADREYLDELSRIGQQRRLEDDVAFRQDLTRTALGDEMTETLKSIGFQEDLGQQRRDWEKILTQMGADFTVDLARSAIKQANTNAQWAAGGTIAGAGLDYAASSGAFDSSPTTDTQFREDYGAPAEGSQSFGGSR